MSTLLKENTSTPESTSGKLITNFKPMDAPLPSCEYKHLKLGTVTNTNKTIEFAAEIERASENKDSKRKLSHVTSVNNESIQLTQFKIVGRENSVSYDDFSTGNSAVLRISSSQTSLNCFKQAPKKKNIFICSHCCKSFSTKRNLIRHERAHERLKPYSCTYCGKSFTDPSTLKVHERRHTGEKPYRCEECGARFIQSSTLTSHRHAHLKLKQFVCDDCGKSFVQKAQLDRHYQIHKDTRNKNCSFCNKKFRTTQDVNRHTKIHTHEKPFVCPICSARFSRVDTLKNHSKKIHSAAQSFSTDLTQSNRIDPVLSTYNDLDPASSSQTPGDISLLPPLSDGLFSHTATMKNKVLCEDLSNTTLAGCTNIEETTAYAKTIELPVKHRDVLSEFNDGINTPGIHSYDYEEMTEQTGLCF